MERMILNLMMVSVNVELKTSEIKGGKDEDDDESDYDDRRSKRSKSPTKKSSTGKKLKTW